VLPRKIVFSATLLQMLCRQKLTPNPPASVSPWRIRKSLKLPLVSRLGVDNYKLRWNLVFKVVLLVFCFRAILNQEVTMLFAAFVFSAKAWMTIKSFFAKAAIWQCISLVTASKIYLMVIGFVTVVC
jgi:hypothetical protein